MNKLLLATALSVVLATAANAGIVATLTSGNDTSFNTNSVGDHSGTSTSYWDGSNQPISFVAGADTTGVSIGFSSGVYAEPFGDSSNFLWGLNDGTTVTFGDGRTDVSSFVIHWGSVDSAGTGGDGYNNVLTLSNGDSITGADLVAAGLATGTGNQADPNNNPWLLITDSTPFTSFTATSPRNAFEFDLSTVNGVPESSTWVMMGLGFAGLGFAGFRSRKLAPIAA